MLQTEPLFRCSAVEYYTLSFKFLKHWPIQFKFSVTCSCVLLPRSTAWSDWKIVLFVKFKSLQISVFQNWTCKLGRTSIEKLPKTAKYKLIYIFIAKMKYRLTKGRQLGWEKGWEVEQYSR